MEWSRISHLSFKKKKTQTQRKARSPWCRNQMVPIYIESAYPHRYVEIGGPIYTYKFADKLTK